MKVQFLLIGVAFALMSSAALAAGNDMRPAMDAEGEVAVPTPIGAGPMEPVSPEVDAFNQAFMSNYYGLSTQTISDLRARGHSWGEIHLMANASARTQRPIQEICMHRIEGRTWAEIAQTYNVTVAELTRPYMPVARVAGFVGEVRAAPHGYYQTDRFGNPVLTMREAELYRVRGYEWRTIAIAANVSAQTAYPVREILRMVDMGQTWPQIAMRLGLRIDDIIDVAEYPFTREPVRGMAHERRMAQQHEAMAQWYGLRPAPVGAGPMVPAMEDPMRPMDETPAHNY